MLFQKFVKECDISQRLGARKAEVFPPIRSESKCWVWQVRRGPKIFCLLKEMLRAEFENREERNLHEVYTGTAKCFLWIAEYTWEEF